MRAIPTLFLAMTAVYLTTANGTAQEKPNFSGTWVLSPDSVRTGGGPRPGSGSNSQAGGRTGGGGGGGAGNLGGSAFACGTECAIIQTAKTLTIKRPANTQGVTPPVVVLNLDGSDSKNQQAGRVGGPHLDSGPLTDYVAHAKWSGNTLVVTRASGNGQIVTTQTLALQGGKLTIAHSINLDVTLPTLVYTKK